MCLSNKGFTLIELLVAMALLVILSGALYGTYFSVVSAREHAGARSEERRELSSTLGLMRNEIASSFYVVTPTPTSSQAKVTATSPGQNLEFVVEDRDSFGKPASLMQFTAIVPPRVDAPPSSDVEAVRYSVVEKDGTLTLARESKDLYLQVKSAPYDVIDNIESFQVECYDGSKWLKTWDTSFTHKLPDCVRATVTLKGGESYAVVATPGMARKSAAASGLAGLGGLNLPSLGALKAAQP